MSVNEISVVASEQGMLLGIGSATDRSILPPEQGTDLSRIAMRLLRDTRSEFEYIFPSMDVGQMNQFLSGYKETISNDTILTLVVAMLVSTASLTMLTSACLVP